MRITEKDAARWIESSVNGMEAYKNKLYSMRRAVLGDRIFGANVTSRSADPGQSEARDGDTNWPDVLTMDVESGRSNFLMQTVRTLTFQVSFAYPDIEFRNIDTIEAFLNEAYLDRILGSAPRGCDAKSHFRLGVADVISGGLGPIHVCTDKNGRPKCEYVDTMDIDFDQSARLPGAIKWVSMSIREPRWYWEELFGKATIAKTCQGNEAHSPIELKWYYDAHGEGNFIVFPARSGKVEDGKVVYKGKNPYRMVEGGEEKPFLPIDMAYFMAVPSARFAVGPVETMIPHQVAIWEAERTNRRIVQAAGPIDEIEEGSFTDEELKAYMSGKQGAFLQRKAGMPGLTRHDARTLNPALIEYMRDQKEMLQGQSGTNPYASGTRVEVDYAAETNAIQSQSALVASVIAKDHAAQWERVCQKLLYLGAEYDDTTFSLTLDNQRIVFGPDNPVSQYLRPDADIVVRESAIQFQDKRQQIATELQKLEVAQQVSGTFPNAVPLAYEAFLKATGDKQVAKYTQPGVQAMDGVETPL